MNSKDIDRNPTYHKLLSTYIDQIGAVERVAEAGELSCLQGDAARGRCRFVGCVAGRKGAWDLYLVRIDTTGPFRLTKRRLHRYHSRRIAEIMARYTAAVAADQQAKTPRADQESGIVWN